MITKEIAINVTEEITLRGNLTIPGSAKALVVFSHGSGSSRFSPRNRQVAEILNDADVATLLTDLLTEEEDSNYATRFNIDLITERLVSVINAMSARAEFSDFPIGCFGASTGAASALRAAAKLPELVKAVVSRGGRPDLAGEALTEVKAPTLLIVGSLDEGVIQLNESAFSDLNCVKEFKIIPGATHLFEEPGKLNEVAMLAKDWFKEYLQVN